MARQWIYLYEESPDNVAINQSTAENSAKKTPPNPEISQRNLDSLKNGRDQDLADAGNSFKAGKDKLISAGQKQKQILEEKRKQRQAVQNASATLLDEENDDASIIDGKSKEEQDKEVKPEDIKTEKQPLQELMSLYKFISQ